MGLEVYGPDLRVLRSNAASLALRGMAEAQVVGASLADLDAGIALSPIMREVLDAHEVVRGRTVAAAPAFDPGNQHLYSVTAYPLWCDGQVPGAVAAMILDVTDHVRRQKASDLLAVARSRIGTTLDATRTVQELADMAVPAFADAVAVDLAESVFDGDALIGPVTTHLPMRRAAFVSHEGQYGAYPVGGASQFTSHTPYTRALADLRPRLVDLATKSDVWLVHDRMRAEFIVRSGAHSMIVAPLTVHGLVLGLVSFYRTRSSPEPFGDDDLSLATQLASCTAVCIDNARRFTREHVVATALQRSLLPRDTPRVSAVEASHCYRVGRYGAHWFEVLPLSSCRVGLIIGYVPGEDLQASVAMARLRTAASTLAAMDLPANELLAHLDDVTQRLAGEQEADPATLHRARPPFTASCLYMTYDPVTLRCTAASAGHNSPLVTSPEGVVSTLGVPRGAALGRGEPHEVVSVELAPGSLLSLYSDGSVDRHPSEARDRVDRLRGAVAEPLASPDDICDQVSYQVLRGGTPQDGAALLVARTRSVGADNVASWTLPARAISVREARRTARDRLARWGLEEYSPVTDLIVSELATNVIEHAEGPIRLRLIRDRVLTVEVADDANTTPRLRHARLQDEDGRGVFLIASLADRWGMRYEDVGKTIWAEQTLTAA
ncbi:SpoIIE family protein phosphatase [Streptomyces sp. ME109]|uniref:SpoIIE family protein phosphatase n=1 Tax=Streptomyces sp. me109 TaxID=1827853 RepID=UPI001650EF52|nr:SpoIIE family protein phosphatase [Streptomyces sp. me109]